MEKRADSSWIVSARFDLAIVLVPMAAALAALGIIRGLDVEEPLWAYLLFFVSFDVAHVWGTLYLTYLDREVMRRRKRMLIAVVPLCFAACMGLHVIAPVAFWTVLAYVAIAHFAKQQYGFIAIYKAKAKERDLIDFRLDKWTLWTGALGPVLLWHSAPRGQFDWFGSGEEFLFTLPEAFHPWVLGLMACTALVWGGRQVFVWRKYGRFTRGKVLWMVASWISWFVGVLLSEHLFVSAAFLNLFHGVPYLGLVWRRCNVRWQGQRGDAGSRLVGWLSQRSRWWLFYGLLVVLALVEEALWDGVVWKKYLPEATGLKGPALSGVAMAFWVALLSLPQVVHYYLDSVLWKMNTSNPDLRAMFSPPSFTSGEIRKGR